MQEIIIWDDNATRIHSLERNLKVAMQKVGIHALIQINCEPPLLSRYNLIGQTPKIEIDTEMWTYKIGEEVPVEQFELLLLKTIVNKDKCACKEQS